MPVRYNALMSNQSKLPTEKGYPERLALGEGANDWAEEVPAYSIAPLNPDFKGTAERLEARGVIVESEHALRQLATLTTKQALELYGPAVQEVRNPLGRTGINGTGIFYNAGEAPAADMAVLRQYPEIGLEIALVYSRRWGLPGGFVEPGDGPDRRVTAVREGSEELGIDLTPFLNAGLVKTLVPLGVKPNSKRSVDYGFITTQVEHVVLPEAGYGDAIIGSDDAEQAGWFTPEGVAELAAQKTLSSDHYDYIKQAFAF